jgi:hypothetical protein
MTQARTSTVPIRSVGTDLHSLRFDLTRDFPDDLSRFQTTVAHLTITTLFIDQPPVCMFDLSIGADERRICCPGGLPACKVREESEH